jgi:hypothetical protein
MKVPRARAGPPRLIDGHTNLPIDVIVPTEAGTGRRYNSCDYDKRRGCWYGRTALELWSPGN